MTIVAIMAGLIPILWTTGTDSEVTQSIAVPMIGSMISSTILRLVVNPSVYALTKGFRLPVSQMQPLTPSNVRQMQFSRRASINQ